MLGNNEYLQSLSKSNDPTGRQYHSFHFMGEKTN